jgi:hypothetical protein
MRPGGEQACQGGEHSLVVRMRDISIASPAIVALVDDCQRHAATIEAVEVLIGRKAIWQRIPRNATDLSVLLFAFALVRREGETLANWRFAYPCRWRCSHRSRIRNGGLCHTSMMAIARPVQLLHGSRPGSKGQLRMLALGGFKADLAPERGLHAAASTGVARPWSIPGISAAAAPALLERKPGAARHRLQTVLFRHVLFFLLRLFECGKR